MEKKKISSLRNTLMLLGVLVVSLIVVNIILLYFVSSTATTVTLLTGELHQLEMDQEIIRSSQQISEQYTDEIEFISGVFPDETTILEFIQSLEGIIRDSAVEYNFKFSSLTPIVERDRQFLLMTVTMMTDGLGLTSFLSELEQLPYMTHVTSVSARTPEGFADTSEATIVLKIYVQNPFTTK